MPTTPKLGAPANASGATSAATVAAASGVSFASLAASSAAALSRLTRKAAGKGMNPAKHAALDALRVIAAKTTGKYMDTYATLEGAFVFLDSAEGGLNARNAMYRPVLELCRDYLALVIYHTMEHEPGEYETMADLKAGGADYKAKAPVITNKILALPAIVAAMPADKQNTADMKELNKLLADPLKKGPAANSANYKGAGWDVNAPAAMMSTLSDILISFRLAVPTVKMREGTNKFIANQWVQTAQDMRETWLPKPRAAASEGEAMAAAVQARLNAMSGVQPAGKALNGPAMAAQVQARLNAMKKPGAGGARKTRRRRRYA